MKLAGHKTASIFARYNVVGGGSDFKDAAARLDAAFDHKNDHTSTAAALAAESTRQIS
jgi:hypothetical protein